MVDPAGTGDRISTASSHVVPLLCLFAVILLGLGYLGWRLYFSMSGDFAEEL